MNLRIGGIGGSGTDVGYWSNKKRAPHSEETRRKMSKTHTGKKMSPEAIEKIRKNAIDRIFTDETRKRMSESNRGYQSDESKRKISIANSVENNGMYGKTAPEETRKKMSEPQRLRWASISEDKKLERSEKLRNANLGRPVSEDTKKKISNTLKGIPQPKLTCPHYHKVGGAPQMKRYHFDKCKQL